MAKAKYDIQDIELAFELASSPVIRSAIAELFLIVLTEATKIRTAKPLVQPRDEVTFGG